MKYRDDLLHMELSFRFSISFSKTEDFLVRLFYNCPSQGVGWQSNTSKKLAFQHPISICIRQKFNFNKEVGYRDN